MDGVGEEEMGKECVLRVMIVGLTLNANEEVPMLSPCPATMLSKFFGGKFKYLNRKNSEFLAGNSNAKCKMQNEKGKCK